MRHSRILALIALVALLGALVGCTNSSAASGELVEHTDEVPAGTPVMYEFFTST